MNRFKTTIGVFLIFACGFAAGAGGMRYYVTMEIDRLTASGPPVARLLMRPDIVNELGLTEVQREKIMKISTQIETEIQDFKQTHHPELVGIIDRGFAEINQLLDADQQARFARIHKKMKRRWEKHRHPFGHSPLRPSPILCITQLSERLNLNADQLAQIQPIVQPYIEKYHNIINNSKGLSRHPGHFPRTEIRALEKEAADRIHPHLTPEQQEVLGFMMSERRHKRLQSPPSP